MENKDKEAVHSEGQNGINGFESTIVLDGEATAKTPEEPSLAERAKKVMENIGTEINGI
ncbi:hypothetical protein [Paenibacillus sp. MMO-177]|uniref:hypothetical protein n=1 Tax=Paenibacillus sp. MMO-177 TaxID=3081289 RepID=UPI00301AC9DF